MIDEHAQVLHTPLVTMIVLNYMNHEETAACVNGLLQQDYPHFQILIVDNASPNDSYDKLTCAFQNSAKVRVVRADSNGGYAAGNNFGVRHLKDDAWPTYLLIVNPDVELREKDTVSTLVRFAELTPDAAVVAPRVILPDGFIQGPYNRPSLGLIAFQYLCPPFWALLRWQAQRATSRLREPKRVFRTVGACMLLVADDFLKVGLFDEGTFLEGEEDILAERLAGVSKYFYYVPAATVVHHHSRRQYENTRAAQRYYFRKYRGTSQLAIWMLMLASRYYEHGIYPFVKMIRELRAQWKDSR